MTPPQPYCLTSSARRKPAPTGAILYGRGVPIKVDEARNDFLRSAHQSMQRHYAFHSQIVDDSARNDAVHHQPVAETKVRSSENPFT